MSGTQAISYDPKYRLASFMGSGGFTQVFMKESNARAIASALDIAFEVKP